MAPIDALLVQALATSRDTVIMKQVAADRGILDQIAAVSSAIITIALLVLVVVSVPVAWHFRKTYRKVNHLLDRIYGDITPIMHHASAITDDVNFITTSIRTDVQKVNATIAAANERVQRAVAVTEDRLNEFNALLSVVQAEAEQLFLSTASTVRGVRTGAQMLRGARGMDLASEEVDAADMAAETDSQVESEEEEDDGDDRSPESAAEGSSLAAAPRVRPRTGTRRRA